VLPHRGIANIMRDLRGVVRGDSVAHVHLRDRVIAIASLTVLIDLVCAVATYYLERHAAGTNIHSFGSSLFWTSAQLLTVSSQMANPLTTGGRIIDIAMEAYAISVVAALAASFGTFLHHRSRQRGA
jgi:voltage-gated potassium channel